MGYEADALGVQAKRNLDKIHQCHRFYQRRRCVLIVEQTAWVTKRTTV